MTEKAMSRRTVLEAGVCGLVAAAAVPQLAGARPDRSEELSVVEHEVERRKAAGR